jgi:hypothetical protein
MTSNRLRRIIRSRWWVLAIASLLSVLAALLITQSRNNDIPAYEAVASITYVRLLGEVDDSDAQDRLEVAEEIAISVNSSDLSVGIDPFSPGVRAEVVIGDRDLRLIFIGRGATQDEAAAVATAMRDRYLAAQQLDASLELAQRIADTAAQLDGVVSALAAATAPPDVADIETSARLRELQAEVDAFAVLYGQLTAELLNPRNPPRPRSTIVAARDGASEGLRTAQDELLSLQFDVGSTTVEDVDLALLRAQEAQLRTTLDTYIAQSIVEEPIGVVNAVQVEETGILPTPPAVAIVVGLSIGLLIGVAGLVIVDRVRQPLWETTELEPRYRLPEVAARPRKLGDSAEPWYSTAPQGRRKADIQELRSAVEGLPGFGDGVVVGVASVTGSSPHAHELAADLAAGLTFSGSWAVLIDTDYGQPSDLAEYRRHNYDLEDVVADPQGTLGLAVRRADRDSDFIGVSIRKSSADAADLLAQPAFARMLDTAQAMHDAVIVASPPTDSSSYHVLSQRLDAMILVAIAGDPVPADVVNALHTLEERRSVPAGVVLIRPRIGPVSLIMNRIDRPPPTSDPVGARQFDWQWSKGQDTKSKSVPISTTHQEPDSSEKGTDSGDFHTGVAGNEPIWQSSEVSPSGDGAPTVASEPSSERGDVDRDIAEIAEGTQRIKRRGSSNGSADKAPVDDAENARSPWSLRNRGA